MKNQSFFILSKTVFKGCLFLFSMIAAKALSKEEFGDFMSLNVLINLGVQPAMVISLVVARKICSFPEINLISGALRLHDKLAGRFSGQLLFLSLVLGVALFFGKGILKIDSVWSSLAVVVTLFFLVYANLYIGIGQGIGRFGSLSIYYITLGFITIVLAFLFYVLKFSLDAMMVAQTLGAIGSFFVLRFLIKRMFRGVREDVEVVSDFWASKYLISMTVGICFFFAFYNCDILIAKVMFNRADAGIFSQLNFLGKAAFVVMGSLSTLIFPSMSMRASKGDRSLKDLWMIGTLHLGAALLISGLIFLLSDPIFKLLFGDKVSDPMAVFMLLLASAFQVQVYFLLHFGFARAFRWLWAAVVIGLALQVSLSLFWGETLLGLAQAEIVAACVTMLLLYVILPFANSILRKEVQCLR